MVVGELAAGAAIRDREYPQFQGTYTVESIPRKFETLFNPGIYDYPVPGRFFNVYSPYRGMVSTILGSSGTLIAPDAPAADEGVIIIRSTQSNVETTVDTCSNYGLVLATGPTSGVVEKWKSSTLSCFDGGGLLVFTGYSDLSLAIDRSQITKIYASARVSSTGAGFGGAGFVGGGIGGYDPDDSAATTSFGIPSFATFTGVQYNGLVNPVEYPDFDFANVVAKFGLRNSTTFDVPPPGMILTIEDTGLIIYYKLQPFGLTYPSQQMVNTTRTQVTELREEVLQLSIDYGPDLYLEKLLAQFNQRADKLLTPTEISTPPNPIDISLVGDFFLTTPDSATILTIQNSSVTGNTVVMDLGAFIGATGMEIRRIDLGWGNQDKNQLVGVFTDQTVVLPRTSRDQSWFLRYKNGNQYSRFSRALRVVYPLIPSPPLLLSSNATQATFDFNGDIRDIYGLEVRIPPGITGFFYPFPPVPEDTFAFLDREAIPVPGAAGVATITHNNVEAVYNPPSDTFFPAPEQFELGDIVFVNSPNDQSFTGEHIVTNVFTATGSLQTGGRIGLDSVVASFYPQFPGSLGGVSYTNSYAPLPAPITRVPITSLQFNSQSYDPNISPIQVDNFDSNGNFLGRTVPCPTCPGNYVMCITGNFVVGAAGTHTFEVLHDDGITIGIDGGATINGIPPINYRGQPFFPGQTTPILGLPITAGRNISGVSAEYGTITFPAAGSYRFEIAFAQWKDNQTLMVRSSDLSFYNAGNLQTILYPASLTSGSPWGLGWFDYAEPIPDQQGSIQLGVPNEIATCQMMQRGPYSLLASAEIDSGGTGLCTLSTTAAHGFSAGEQVIIGSSWQTFPASGYPPLANTGNVFCGIQTVSATPSSTQFQFTSAQLQNPTTPWEIAASQQGVTSHLINGLVALMPTPVNLSALSGVLVQKPVFAPADLIIDFTQPQIAEIVGILEALNPNSLVQGLGAYFFNLTWDYSQPTLIPSFQVPQITGLFVDDNLQQVVWQLGPAGTPTGYRMLVTDPYSGVLHNKYTIDHPHNKPILLQNQMTPTDFFNDRLITVIPFNALGEGQPMTVFHAGSQVFQQPPDSNVQDLYGVIVNQVTMSPLSQLGTVIEISAFTLVFVDIAVNYLAGSVDVLSTSGDYFVYVDDVFRTGGAGAYAAVTDPSFLVVPGRFYIGRINFGPGNSYWTEVGGALPGTPSVDMAASGTFFAGPVSGAFQLPVFRRIALSDLPIATTFVGGFVPSGTINGVNTSFVVVDGNGVPTAPNPQYSLLLNSDGNVLEGNGVGFTITGANLSLVYPPAAVLRAWYSK